MPEFSPGASGSSCWRDRAADESSGRPGRLSIPPAGGLPGLIAAPSGSTRRDRGALALFAATGLPVIVAVTNIGLEQGDLTKGTVSALVGAGMLSVLPFPVLALAVRRSSSNGGIRPPDPEHVPLVG